MSKSPEFKAGMDEIAAIFERMSKDGLIECASLVIVPKDGDATSSGIITWTPTGKEFMSVEYMYHELVCSMVWGLMINGCLGTSVLDAVMRAREHFPNVSVIDGRVFESGGVN